MPEDKRPAVLYIDDEEVNLRVFDINFRSHFKILTALGGEAALAIVDSRQHDIGVVITDQRMPKMTGVDFLERVKTTLPDAYRIIITAYTDVSAVLEAINRGEVSRYVVKPWTKEDLQLVLDDAMRIYSLQSRLRDVEARMLKSAHLVAMGQVAAGIAHEINNPLSYVAQNLATLRIQMEPATKYVGAKLAADPNEDVGQTFEELPDLLNDLDRGVEHIRNIVARVKKQARGVDTNESSDLKEISQFVARMTSQETQERARLVHEGPSLVVKVGPVTMTQVLLNLVVNAAQAMDGLDRRGRIDVTWEKTADGAVCRVSDNGSGIAPENLEKVFEPLFTTKPVGVGTGLGLPICRDLIRAAGGDIRLTSKVGEGTTVELRLPVPAAPT